MYLKFLLVSSSNCCAVFTDFILSIITGRYSRMTLKGSHETRRVMIAKLICDLFNRHIRRCQHLHCFLKPAVTAKLSYRDPGINFKQMAQPRYAQSTTVGKIGERAGRVFIQEVNCVFDPEIVLKNFHKSSSLLGLDSAMLAAGLPPN